MSHQIDLWIVSFHIFDSLECVWGKIDIVRLLTSSGYWRFADAPSGGDVRCKKNAIFQVKNFFFFKSLQTFSGMLIVNTVRYWYKPRRANHDPQNLIFKYFPAYAPYGRRGQHTTHTLFSRCRAFPRLISLSFGNPKWVIKKLVTKMGSKMGNQK